MIKFLMGWAILRVGARWHEPEFLAYSCWDEDDRISARKTREALDPILTLWDKNNGRIDFSGKYYFSKGAVPEPKPTRDPHTPLWFGTNGDCVSNTAARLAQCWFLGIPRLILERYKRVTSIHLEIEKELQENLMFGSHAMEQFLSCMSNS